MVHTTSFHRLKSLACTNMNLEDQKRQQISPPLPPPYQHSRRRHRYKNLVDLALRTFSAPRCYFTILFILSFILGYLSHSRPQISQCQAAKVNNDLAAPNCFSTRHARSSLAPSPPTSANDDLAAHNSFPNRCANPLPYPHIRKTILDRAFNGTSPWEGFPPPHASSLLWREWTKGWGSNAAVFEHLIRQVLPKTIIEVGTFLGASATHMAGLTRKLGLNTLILCIDDFRGWPGYYDEEKSMKIVNGDSMLLYQFMQNVVKANVSESILFLPFSTTTALGGLCEWGVFGDLVEIDAAHDFHSAWVDINNAFKVLRPGGVIFGHDYVWPGVKRAVHLFARLHGFRVRKDGEHWIVY